MFSHEEVWSAIDALAERKEISVSRLAREAGLDPTTFNKSKRTGADGRQRWPSTESLAKIMQSTHTSLEQFLGLLVPENKSGSLDFASQNYRFPPDSNSMLANSGLAESGETVPWNSDFTSPSDLALQSRQSGSLSVPLLGLAQAGVGGFFDEAGLPTGEGWDAVDFPHLDGENAYALEVAGDSMLPLYRDGDRIIVSPTSSIRRGDRVVVRTIEGEVMAKILARQTARTLELHSLNPDHPPLSFHLAEIDWVARIIWASQ